MTPQEIDRFFAALAGQFNIRTKIILTGAAAGAVWGSVRSSLDIDYAIEIELSGQDPRLAWDKVQKAIQKTVALTGIPVNYASDIDRWGAISLLDYKKHVTLYKRFGAIKVYTLDPAYWSIGKITRYLEPDIQDMIAVFRGGDIAPELIIVVWGKAVRNSPVSTAQFEFRKHVEHFIWTYGAKIWGEKRNLEKLLDKFFEEAGISD